MVDKSRKKGGKNPDSVIDRDYESFSIGKQWKSNGREY